MLGERWGVTDEEVAAHYPCDDLIGTPTIELWRGVTVNAAPAQVWPWVTQVRLAPYSYDKLDNLGRRSPQQLLGLPDPVPGDRFTMVGGKLAAGRIRSVVPQQHLTGFLLGTAISYVLRPTGDTTRLLMKLTTDQPRWYAVGLALGDWPMARRQLLNFKKLAEKTEVAA